MNVLIKLLQLVFTLMILPFVYAAVYYLPSHMVAYPTDAVKMFMVGALAFVAIYLFVYQGREIQAAGQNVISRMFGFSPPLQSAAVKIFSFYLLLAILLFFIVSRGFGVTQYNPHLMFLMGFFFAMHNVLTAVSMQEEDSNKIFKIDYLSSFIMVLTVNIILLILLFDAVKMKWTFGDYAWKVLESGRDTIIWIIDHLPFRK